MQGECNHCETGGLSAHSYTISKHRSTIWSRSNWQKFFSSIRAMTNQVQTKWTSGRRFFSSRMIDEREEEKKQEKNIWSRRSRLRDNDKWTAEAEAASAYLFYSIGNGLQFPNWYFCFDGEKSEWLCTTRKLQISFGGGWIDTDWVTTCVVLLRLLTVAVSVWLGSYKVICYFTSLPLPCLDHIT